MTNSNLDRSRADRHRRSLGLTTSVRRPAWRLGVVVPLVALLTLGVPVSAVGQDVSDGLWYFDALKIGEHHAAGWTGKGVTIAVVDTPINLNVPTLQGADVRVQEQNYCQSEATGEFYPPTSDDLGIRADHGTNIVSYIVGTGTGYPGQQGVKGIAPDATIIYFAEGFQAWDDCETAPVYAFNNLPGGLVERVIASGADILSISANYGIGIRERAKLLRAGVIVLGAGSNNRLGGGGFLAGTNGVVTVQMGDASGSVYEQGERVDFQTGIVAPGIDVLSQGSDGDWQQQKLNSGTSVATPMVAGMLALVKQKYPTATNNQLLQSLIRNASGAIDGEAHFDETGQVGYGLASVTRMLETDPTAYPDISPFLLRQEDSRFDYTLIPTYDEVFNPRPLEPWEEGYEEENPEPEPASPPTFDGLITIALIGLGALVLLAITAVVIVVIVRRKHSRTEHGSPSP
ncbi:MAG: S8 family serine peptidase [Cryobacterium sp.]|nr:S8 family serine peptidase [Cryobacterium sp.]